MRQAPRADTAEKFIILGDVGAAPFLPWIERHARRLGLRGHIARVSAGRIEVELSSPPDLIDAMEMGCSLGPMEVWVESIQRMPLAATAPKWPPPVQDAPDFL